MKFIKITLSSIMIIQGLMWLAFSYIAFSKGNSLYMILLMIINGICFVLSPLFLNKHKIYKKGIVLFIFINLILTFTDQMGFFDYAVLVLNILSLILVSSYLYLVKSITNQ